MFLRLHPLLCVPILSVASLAQKSGQQKPDGGARHVSRYETFGQAACASIPLSADALF
jgi:hypothetical protein